VEQTIQNPAPEPTPIVPVKNSKRPIIIAVLGLGITILIATTLLLLFLSRTQIQKPLPTTSVKRQNFSKVKDAPQVVFKDYSYPNELPASPTSINTYQLKSDFSLEEATTIAAKFNLTKYKNNTPNTIVFYDEAKPNYGLLSFNLKTGAFNFESYGTYNPFSSTPKNTAASLLTTLGIQDGTISCEITYKKKSVTGVTFVECHRDWTKLQAPLVTLPGMLNAGEQFKLSTWSEGIVDPLAPLDSDVVDTSSGQDGYARPTDFNTITIGVREDGSILSVTSNIRWTQPNSITKTTAITALQAITEFRNGKAQYSLTIPAGVGTTNWEKVYPENKAVAEKAVIKDIVLVYVENIDTTTQSSYTPSYLIRGTAELSSGYTVNFVQTIPAVANTTGYTGHQQVAGVATTPQNTNANIKLGTFIPEVTKTPTPKVSTTPVPGVKVISPTPPPNLPQACFKDGLLGTQTFQLPGYGTITVGRTGLNHNTYFFQNATVPVGDIEGMRDLFYRIIEQQVVINLANYLILFPKFINQDSIQGGKMMEYVREHMKEHQDDVPTTPVMYGATGQFERGVYPVNSESSPLYPPRQQERLKLLVTNVDKEIGAALKDGTMTSIARRPSLGLGGDDPASPFTSIFGMGGGNVSGLSSCYLTGESPFIFLYPTTPQQVTVTTEAKVTYSYPAIENNSWNIFADPSGTGLYYEYDPATVTFSKPTEGFVIKRNELEKTVTAISQKLQLNDKEGRRLQQEVSNALVGSDSSYIIVSIANKEEVNKNLPLSFSPQPESVNRIMLILNPTNSLEKLKTPTIQSLTRHGFTVIELGAYLLK